MIQHLLMLWHETIDRAADSYCPVCHCKLALGHEDVMCRSCGRTWAITAKTTR